MISFFASVLRFLAKLQLDRVNPKKIITVTGSIGKTSTTQAIAHVLRETGHNVLSTRHNYNNNLGVPVSILGYDLPNNAKNPISWLILFIKATMKVILPRRKYDYIVLELGTDKPGDIAQFAWVKPDIAVVTAVAPEHMETFKTIENVAVEELSVGSFAEMVLVNRSTVSDKYLPYAKNNEVFHYDAELLKSNQIKKSQLNVVGEHSLDALAAALWIAKHENIDKKDYKRALSSYESPPGRMRIFEGKHGSKIIDDTYNSSPEAAIAALQHLYSETANHRIVLLGNMNELGDSSKSLHEKVGQYCNKTKLDLVVTLGQDANLHTAKTAEKNGCNVVRTDTPQAAAEAILEKLSSYNRSDTTIILCKGSQNNVFAEEAVKLLLKNSSDSKHLVRQSKRWKEKKKDVWVER